MLLLTKVDVAFVGVDEDNVSEITAEVTIEVTALDDKLEDGFKLSKAELEVTVLMDKLEGRLDVQKSELEAWLEDVADAEVASMTVVVARTPKQEQALEYLA